MSIADLRREYTLNGLSEAAASGDPIALFERWFRDAIDSNLPLPNAMTLATATPRGLPDARVVLLKGIEAGSFVFYTSYLSRKGRELEQNPLACLVFLWTELERQVRIEGSVEKVDAAASDAYFATRPLGARLSAWASAQSEPVSGREELERALEAAEARYGENPPRPAHWGGYRVVPASIEFWQGRENRLHDRLLYRRADGGWKIERLAP